MSVAIHLPLSQIIETSFHKSYKAKIWLMLTYHFSRKRALRTKEVQFGLLSAEETRRMATVTVSNPNIMHRGTPQTKAVNDLLMGSIDRRLKCSTCGGDVRSCQGHPGVIELGVPVYSIGFLDPTLKCLRCVCYFCSRLLITPAESSQISHDDLKGKQLFGAVHQVARTRKRCLHCHAPQPTYQRVMNTIKIDWPSETHEFFEDEQEKLEVTSRVFNSIEAHSILNHISDEDSRLMGFKTEFAHPRDMVQDVVHVIPPIARPAIMQSTGSRIRGQDDLTHCLQSILKRSIDLKTSMSASGWSREKPLSTEMQDRLGKLQNDVFAMVNNSVRGNRPAVQRSGAPFKSLVCRIRGKEGRIRGNLNGKRVDFSARSVVTPDSVMAVDEVGVPEPIALELTLQEKVTNANINSLRKRVLAGADTLNGAQSVIDVNGIVTYLQFCNDTSKINLIPGMVVERYMQDGDIIIFNRQPSLHKFSIMAHRARIMPGLTLRLNLSCTTAYNADFDGDEMNLHLLQSPLAIEEARGLMSVANNVISPQSNRPVIAIVQDTLLGSSLLTEVSCLLTQKQYMRYVCWIEDPVTEEKAGIPPPAILFPEPLWTGSQLFSALLPPSITMSRGSTSLEWPSESDVLVRRGQLLYGRTTKSVLGPASGGLIDCIARDAGARAIIIFESDLQRVIAQFLLQRGFSVKMSDCVLSDKGDAEVNELIKVATQNARAIVETPLPETMRSAAESTVQNCLSKLLMQTGSIAKRHMRADNAIATMVHIGSKGSPINLCQIAGTVAQQTVEGKRITQESASRTLSCYKNGDKNLEASGFVESNYQRGLNPQEFFFHAMGGREGLVDTAVKTACTGYIQRRQVKMTEDHHICYDGTVRTAQDHILEFVYGGDGFDASRIERFALRALLMNDEKIYNHFVFLKAHGELRRLLLQEKACFDALIVRARDARISPMATNIDPMCVLPFNPDRVIALFCEKHTRTKQPHIDVEYVQHVLEQHQAFSNKVLQDADRCCLAATVRFHFNSISLHSLMLDAQQINLLFELLSQYFHEAIVAAGEMVGTVAATSMGEVTTQLTLNTFHTSGVGSRAVTAGIPRLKEILDVTRKMRTPSNTLVLHDPYASSLDFATRFARTLSKTMLSDLVVRIDLLYEPDFSQTNIDNDRMMVEMENYLTSPPKDSSEWVARLMLSKAECQARDITPPDIHVFLKDKLGDEAHVLSSQVNALEWCIRIRLAHVRRMIQHGFPNEPITNSTLEETMVQRIVSRLADTVQISGHECVQSATERESEVWDPETSTNVKKHVVDTLGINLNQLGLIPCVDWERSTTNSLHEVLEVLGIEATMHVLFHEVRTTITGDGSYVDSRHMLQIAASMTTQGWLKAISRHGMNKPGSGTGPLVRCSFEETSDVLMDAALFGEIDDSRGVTSSIINGDMARIGSGAFDVLMPDSCFPMPTQTSRPRSSKLVKSKVRSVTTEPLISSVEMVDTSLWSFNNTRQPQSVEVPFSEQESMDVDKVNSSGQIGNAVYGEPPTPRHWEGIFVPSSPQMVQV